MNEKLNVKVQLLHMKMVIFNKSDASTSISCESSSTRKEKDRCEVSQIPSILIQFFLTIPLCAKFKGFRVRDRVGFGQAIQIRPKRSKLRFDRNKVSQNSCAQRSAIYFSLTQYQNFVSKMQVELDKHFYRVNFRTAPIFINS